jgi:hypothetical protein
VLGGLLVVGVTGCTAADPSEAAPLDRATGAVLADAADRLASALEEGDACQAHAEVEALEARADAAHRAGEAPEEVVAETVRVARAVTAGIVCGDATPVTLDDEDPAEGADDAEVAPDVEVEAAPAEPAPAPAEPASAPTEPASAPAEATPGGQVTAGRGNGNSDGARGNGRGNDGRGNSGSGRGGGRG